MGKIRLLKKKKVLYLLVYLILFISIFFNVKSEQITNDGFESNNFLGGYNWLNPWNTNGYVITFAGLPHDGIYSAFINGLASMNRSFNTSSHTNNTIGFWLYVVSTPHKVSYIINQTETTLQDFTSTNGGYQYYSYNIPQSNNITIYFNNYGYGSTTYLDTINITGEIQNISSCSEDWVQDIINCQIDDTYTITYTDLNGCGTYNLLPVNNGTEAYCNYCSEDLYEILGECMLNETQSVDYVDNNYYSCCDVTGLSSDCNILSYPYNETTSQSCDLSKTELGEMICPSQFDFKIREKEYCVVNIPKNYSNEDFKCIVYVTDINETILQTTPIYKEVNGWIGELFSGEPESRTYYEPSNGIVNFYITKKNLRPDHQYILNVQCDSTNRTLISSQVIEVGYEPIDELFNRLEWAKVNSGLLLMWMMVIFVILSVLVLMIGWIKK